MIFKRALLIAFALSFTWITQTRAADQYPKPTGFVNDYAGVLSAPERQRVESLAREIRSKAGFDIAFATMDSIPDGQDISLYAVELAHAWGVGNKGSDRGVLLFYKTGADGGKRQVYLATGYGIEGEINDAKAGRILDSVTIPLLKEGRVGDAFVATAATVSSILAPNVKLTGGIPQYPQRGLRGREKPNIVGMIVMVVIVAILMSSRTGRAILFGFLIASMMGGRRGGWGGGGGFGGGGFGGGFGGFGGGGFGGGGAGRSF